MNIPWIICGTGILFCLSGVYFFFRNIFEERRSVKWALLIILMGIMLIAAGTAQYIELAGQRQASARQDGNERDNPR